MVSSVHHTNVCGFTMLLVMIPEPKLGVDQMPGACVCTTSLLDQGIKQLLNDMQNGFTHTLNPSTTNTTTLVPNPSAWVTALGDQ